MTKRRTALLRAVATTLFAGAVAWGQSGNPGQVNYLEYANSNFDAFTNSPNQSQEQWMQSQFAAMVVWSPYFDSSTSWYSNAYVYQDLYAVYPGSWIQNSSPQWIAHDQYGNWLYVNFACSWGTCPEYAADISNPAYRAWWISQAQATIAQGNYPGLFIDDVNMNFNVSDGNGNFVAPIDSNTGQPMTYDAWRSYVATFVQQIRSALPNERIMHNAIWYAGPAGVQANDQYIQAEISAATTINLERGIASDSGITGGTGQWSAYAFFNYVDLVHSLGKGISYEEYQLTPAGQLYGLASYLLISNGNDFISDQTATPNNWYNGYDVNMGSPTGARTYTNGIFRRNFTGGIVLLGEPGLSPQTIQLPGNYQDLNGNTMNSITIGGSQGAVLLNAGGGTPTAQAVTPAPSGSGVTRYLNQLTPNYSVNGYGNVQVNRSTGGTPLSINGVQYAQGLGVNAYSEQHWAMYGNCTSFTATVGVDSTVPSNLGWIDFQVWGDGTQLYDSGYMHGWSSAGQVNVQLNGYQTLALVVTNGTYMAPSWTTYNDNGDWVNPIIVCNN